MDNQETPNANIHPTEFIMAGFGPRWGAILVDVNILLVVAMLIFRSVIPNLRSGNILPSELSNVSIIGGILLYFIGLPLISILYQSIFESSKFQGTPGKIAVKIKVVNLKGERITFLQALGRNSGKIVSGLILNIGFLMAIWTVKKQALHDIIANTYVVHKR